MPVPLTKIKNKILFAFFEYNQPRTSISSEKAKATGFGLSWLILHTKMTCKLIIINLLRLIQILDFHSVINDLIFVKVSGL